jgi:hypothetical protein
VLVDEYKKLEKQSKLMPKLIVNLRKKIQDLGVLENTEKSSAPLTMKLLKKEFREFDSKQNIDFYINSVISEQ